jgi:P pilus assembly chaperone PapD
MKINPLAFSPIWPRHRALCLVLLTVLAAPMAMADLMLYPTRVVMEKNQRAAQIELINRGLAPESYRISIVDRRMTETGEIVSADSAEPNELFASDMLRYSPRQVSLKPGESQTVRISLRKPAGLSNGEYRSHLQFDRLPDVEGSSDLAQAVKPEPGQISIRLTALIGASIPVIVRHGDTAANVTLESLILEPTIKTAGQADGLPLLAFRLNRSGNRSVYGNLLATYTPPGGKAVEVGQVNGVAVYVPNAVRLAKLPIRLPEGTTLKGGALRLTFSQRPEEGGNPLVQASLAVP